MRLNVARLSTGLLGAAASIALLTLLARVVGFFRTVALGQTLGADCLGSAYTTANAVPNVVFEVVAGGALAGAVVPLLAGAAGRGERDAVAATVRALTGWVLLLLVPAALAVVVFASPIIDLLLGGSSGCDAAQVHSVATSLLVVFAVQIPIYGLVVVAQGTLQAHRQFMVPALAPLVSSLVVIATYGLYAWLSGPTQGQISALTQGELALLAWGTTLGVVALWVIQWPGMSSQRLLIVRPRLHFPPGMANRARNLAAAGAVTVAAQWVAFGVALRLANDRGIQGAALVYTLAWTMFLLPWSVLALPVVTSAFPRLSSLFDVGDEAGFTRTSAITTRAVVVAGGLGFAGLVATARPLSNLMLLGAPGPDQTQQLAHALMTFAPGVLGFAVAGHVSRLLYARHQGSLAASLMVGGWLLGTVVAVWATQVVAGPNVPAALGTGSTVGMLVAGAIAIVVMRSVVGRGSTLGLARTTLGTVPAVLVSGGIGLALSFGLPNTSRLAAAVTALLVGAVVVVIFALVVGVVDRAAWSALVERIRSSRRQDPV